MTNVDDFLAHYGVAGMKWGRRKTVQPGTAIVPRQTATPEQIARRKAIVKKTAVVAGSVAVVAGAAAVAVLMAKSGKTPVSQIAHAPATSVGHDLLTLSRSAASSAASTGQTSFGRVAPAAASSWAVNAARSPAGNVMGNTNAMMNQFNARYRV